MVQLVKNPPAMQETWVWSLGWEDPLEKGTATHSNILAWRIPWTVWPMELQSVGHNWVTFTFLNNNNVRLEKQNLNAKMFLTYFSQGLSEQMIPGTMLGFFKYVASFPLSYHPMFVAQLFLLPLLTHCSRCVYMRKRQWKSKRREMKGLNGSVGAGTSQLKDKKQHMWQYPMTSNNQKKLWGYWHLISYVKAAT